MLEMIDRTDAQSHVSIFGCLQRITTMCNKKDVDIKRLQKLLSGADSAILHWVNPDVRL